MKLLSSIRVWHFLAVIIVTGIAITLGCGLLPYTMVRGYLDTLADDGSAAPFTPAIHLRLQVAAGTAGAMLTICGILLWLNLEWVTAAVAASVSGFRSDVIALLDEWGLTSRSSQRIGRTETCFVLGSLLIGGVLRALYLNQPIRYDEAHSWLEYASRPWFITISKYEDPNNHIFHNLLVNVVSCICGDAEWALRLPAFTAGLVMIPLTYLLGRVAEFEISGNQLNSRVSAVGAFASLFVATSSPLIEYSTNARGYTILSVLTLWASLCALHLSKRRNAAAWWGLVLGGALGLWTIPVMLLPLISVGAWFVLQSVFGHRIADEKQGQRHSLFSLVACFIVMGILATLLYLPTLLVANPLAVLSGSEQRQAYSEYLPKFGVTLTETGRLFFRDMPVASLSLFLGLKTVGACMAPRRLQAMQLQLITALVACLAFVVSRKMYPFPRVWLFLLPWAGVVAGVGFYRLLNLQLPLAGKQVCVGIVIAICVVWPVNHMLQHHSILASTETGAFPDARSIAVKLNEVADSNEPLIAVAPCSATVLYYAAQAGLPTEHFDRPHGQLTALVVVAHTFSQTVESVLVSLQLEEEYQADSAEFIADFPSGRLVRVKLTGTQVESRASGVHHGSVPRWGQSLCQSARQLRPGQHHQE